MATHSSDFAWRIPGTEEPCGLPSMESHRVGGHDWRDLAAAAAAFTQVALVVKNVPDNARDAGLMPGWGRTLGAGNGNPLQYSCQENPLERETWGAIVQGSAKNGTGLKRFSTCTQYAKLPRRLSDKESPCNARNAGLIPGWRRPLEVGNCTHFSILAWKISLTEEPGRLQSVGLQRVRCHWAWVL